MLQDPSSVCDIIICRQALPSCFYTRNNFFFCFFILSVFFFLLLFSHSLNKKKSVYFLSTQGVTDIARLAVARQLPPSAGRPGAHTPEGHKWLSVSSPASCRHDIHILHYLFKDLDIPYRTNWPCHTPGERKRKEQKCKPFAWD